MIATVRARYLNGTLVPLEPLGLEEGREVVIKIEDGAGLGPAEDSVLEMFERLHQSAPPETWDSLPADGAKNIDHYLYGAPKEEE
jgi:predicted DNA-binding antitoxin AbrB/MazE fold protein